MVLIAWNEHLSTGIDVVDCQHRGLVDRLNEIAPTLLIERNRAVRISKFPRAWHE